MSGFALFQSFIDFDDAEPTMHALDLAGIPYRVERDRPAVDVTFNLDNQFDQVLLFIPADLREEADKAVKQAEERSPEGEVETEHHFRDFTDEELKGVLYRPKDWAPNDEKVARMLLTKRGITVDPQEIADRQQRDQEISHRPVAARSIAIAGGYLMATGGGLLGILMGWFFANSTVRDASGEKYYYYNRRTRRHGWAIMTLGVGSVVFVVSRWL